MSFVLQEAILIILEVAASHSVIPRMFSGNSLVAEIHLQMFLVSPFCFCSGQWLLGLLVFKDYKERSTEGKENGKSARAVINLDFSFLTWKSLRGMLLRGEGLLEFPVFYI